MKKERLEGASATMKMEAMHSSGKACAQNSDPKLSYLHLKSTKRGRTELENRKTMQIIFMIYNEKGTSVLESLASWFPIHRHPPSTFRRKSVKASGLATNCLEGRTCLPLTCYPRAALLGKFFGDQKKMITS